MRSVVVRGYGHAFPNRIVTNDDLARNIDTSDAWIHSRSGIRERRIASEAETTSSLGAAAALEAIKSSESTGVACEVEAVDVIILATTTPDHPMPATATKIQSLIGAVNAFAFDIQAVCAGFLYALSMAEHFIRIGTAKNALVIGADVMSRVVDWTDRSTCVLFGDGAGALLLQGVNMDNDCQEKANSPQNASDLAAHKTSGLLSTHLFSDGSFYDSLFIDRDAQTESGRGAIKMNGRTVFSLAIEKMTQAAIKAVEHNDLAIQDIDWLVVHQANKRIIDVVAGHLGIPQSKIILTIDHFANTCAATIPSTLSVAASSGRLRKGDLILMIAIGGGFAWGSSCLIW
jgi:3-oxoacyl-[acyl-carrier-protein] synthase-3